MENLYSRRKVIFIKRAYRSILRIPRCARICSRLTLRHITGGSTPPPAWPLVWSRFLWQLAVGPGSRVWISFHAFTHVMVMINLSMYSSPPLPWVCDAPLPPLLGEENSELNIPEVGDKIGLGFAYFIKFSDIAQQFFRRIPIQTWFWIPSSEPGPGKSRG